MPKRLTRISIANVLMLTMFVALVARVTLDWERLAKLRREIAFHDAVERQRLLVAQRKLELDAVLKQAAPHEQLQSIYRLAGTNRTGSRQQITPSEFSPPSFGMRRQMAIIRNATLRLKSEQAILEDQERRLRSKVEARASGM